MPATLVVQESTMEVKDVDAAWPMVSTATLLIEAMQVDRISELLLPYIEGLSSNQLGQVSTYLDLLIKWNARMNLTGIRNPEEIVARHFGESFFLARNLPADANSVTDVGSGAGFPGIPIKIWKPSLTITLIEAQQRKATFLREVLRALNFDGEVKNARFEDLLQSHAGSADVVTLRAVEKFDSVLPVAAQLVHLPSPGTETGYLAILIGSAQVSRAKELLSSWHFDSEIPIPGSQNRVILRGNQTG